MASMSLTINFSTTTKTISQRIPVQVKINNGNIENKYLYVYASSTTYLNSSSPLLLKKIAINEREMEITFTKEDMNLLYENFPNTRYIYLCFLVNNYTNTGTKEALINVYCNFDVSGPSLSNDITYKDTNEATVLLTNDNQKIINGYSDVIISNISGEVRSGAGSLELLDVSGVYIIPLQTTQISDLSYDLESINVSSKELYVSLYDSRNVSTKHILANSDKFFDYSPLEKIDIICEREGVSETVRLKFNGKYSEGYNANTNNIIATYKYKEIGTTNYKDGNTELVLTKTLADGNKGEFIFEGAIRGDLDTGFDMKKSYQIEVIVKDTLSSITYPILTIPSATPAISIYKDNIAVHGIYNKELGGTQVNGDLFLNAQKIPEPNSITINKTGETAMSTSLNYYNIGCGNVVYQKGTNLFLSTTNNLETTPANVNCVEVGKNIKAVRVNANMHFANNNTTSDMYFTCLLYHLKVGQTIGTIVGRALTPTIPKEQYATASISPVTVPVEEGDKLYLRAYKSLANGIASVGEGVRTYLTVEAVE